MRFAEFKLTIAALAALAAHAQPAHPPVIVSPEVLADRRVTFRLWAPKANEVQLSGDWMGPKPPAALTKDDGGTWTVTLGPFEPNLYTYGFLVDGVRASDPACRCTLAWASRAASSRFLIAAPTPAAWEERAVTRGTLHHESYFSARLKRIQRFVVYTPPSYRQSGSREYPVLVLLPGTPGDENDWTTGGGFAEVIFDNLIAEKRMEPMIVVMHASDVLRNGRRADNLNELEPILAGELVPEIKRRYRVADAPDSWAIAGLSLGGEFAMTIGLRRPELFRSAASLSGSMVERDFEDRFGRAFTAPEQLGRYRLIWVGCGDQDIFFGGNKTLAQRLRSAGIRHTFVEFPGGHVMPVFRRELVELLPHLFR
jgi:enterochelin esterase family protein